MFTVKVLTPNRVFLNGEEALSIKAPAVEGELNILPGHTHIVARIIKGILKIDIRGNHKMYYVESGICRVLRDGVVFMLKGVVTPEEVNLEQVEAEKHVALSKISGELGFINEELFNKLEDQIINCDLLMKLKTLSKS